jgi:hypothetical protein
MARIRAPIIVDPALVNGWATGGNQQVPSLFPAANPFDDDDTSDGEEDEELRAAIQRSLEPARPSAPPAAGGRVSTPSAPPVTRAPAAPAAPIPSPAPATPAAPSAPSASFAPRYVLDLLKRDAVQKGESCPISMMPFQECKSTTVTSCFHLFETESISIWLKGHTTCPVCKQKVAARVVL